MSETPDVGAMLGKKIGPLPVGGWAAAIVGGLTISWYLRRNGGGSGGGYETAGDETAAPLVPPTGMGGAAVSDPSQPGNITPPTDPGSAGVVEVVPIETNAQWRQQAVKFLVGGNHASGVDSERAMGNYLTGKSLSPGQVALVNKAVAGIGPTPEPVPPIVLMPVPGAATTPNPVIDPNKAWADKFRAWIKRNHPGAGAQLIAWKLFKRIRMTRKEYNVANAAIRALGRPPRGGYMPLGPTSPIAHKVEPTADHHAKSTPHPNARRDVGANTNPGA